jgi:hypothetical protein
LQISGQALQAVVALGIKGEDFTDDHRFAFFNPDPGWVARSVGSRATGFQPGISPGDRAASGR